MNLDPLPLHHHHRLVNYRFRLLHAEGAEKETKKYNLTLYKLNK